MFVLPSKRKRRASGDRMITDDGAIGTNLDIAKADILLCRRSFGSGARETLEEGVRVKHVESLCLFLEELAPFLGWIGERGPSRAFRESLVADTVNPDLLALLQDIE